MLPPVALNAIMPLATAPGFKSPFIAAVTFPLPLLVIFNIEPAFLNFILAVLILKSALGVKIYVLTPLPSPIFILVALAEVTV